MKEIDYLAAFGAGLLSFLSPCVLPLIPGYLSFLSGRGSRDIREGKGGPRLVGMSLAFVLGFTAVFAGLGLLFGQGGAFLGMNGRVLGRAAGILVILLGINTIFDLLAFLNFEKRFHIMKAPKGFLGAFILGAAFAAGWTPCIGPILAGILLYAGMEGEALTALGFLLVYSAGLGIPFILMALFMGRLSPVTDFFKRRAREVRVVSGMLLILMGSAMLLGQLNTVNSLVSKAGMALEEFADQYRRDAKLVAIAAYAALGIAWAITRVVRKKPLLSAAFIAPVLGLAILIVLEATETLRSLDMVANWLLFQGG